MLAQKKKAHKSLISHHKNRLPNNEHNFVELGDQASEDRGDPGKKSLMDKGETSRASSIEFCSARPLLLTPVVQGVTAMSPLPIGRQHCIGGDADALGLRGMDGGIVGVKSGGDGAIGIAAGGCRPLVAVGDEITGAVVRFPIVRRFKYVSRNW